MGQKYYAVTEWRFISRKAKYNQTGANCRLDQLGDAETDAIDCNFLLI